MSIKPVDPHNAVPAGTHFMNADGPVDPAHDLGYFRSECFSPTLGHAIALGFLKDGANKMGEHMRLGIPLTGVEAQVEIVSAHHVDPEGERLRA